MPPKSELDCCGCACCVVEPNSDGAVAGWLCCVLPNKDAAGAGCGVAADAPLDGVSLCSPTRVVQRTIATASPDWLRRVPQQKMLRLLAVFVCCCPMRLQRDHRSLAPMIARSKSQRGRRSRARLSQACSCCRKVLLLLVAMLQAESIRRIVLLLVRVELLLNQRGRRCLRVVKYLSQKNCLHWKQVSIL